jgi:hypothetical protein
MLRLVIFIALALLTASSAFAAKCPVINGLYHMEVPRSDGMVTIHRIERYTRIESGIYSYTVDKEGSFQAADGVARPIQVGSRPGKLRLTCIDGALFHEVWADGFEKQTLVTNLYTIISSKELKRESSFTHLNGIYTKVE